MNKLTKWINDKLGVTKLHAKLQVLVGENRRLETELNKLQNEFHSMDRIDIDFNLHKRGQNTQSVFLTDDCYEGLLKILQEKVNGN